MKLRSYLAACGLVLCLAAPAVAFTATPTAPSTQTAPSTPGTQVATASSERFVADARAVGVGLKAFGVHLKAASGDLGSLASAVPRLGADLDRVERAKNRMATYRVADPQLEPYRAKLVVRTGSVVQEGNSFLYAVQTGDPAIVRPAAMRLVSSLKTLGKVAGG